MNNNETLIVAGITRSGLSLTMQMLFCGDFPCAGKPPAFECYSIGEIPWPELGGKAVKLVDAQHQLPPAGNYRVIRLHRDITQQARSINKFNAAFGLPAIPVSQLMGSIRRDYEIIDQWAEEYPVLELSFEHLILSPLTEARAIESFVCRSLNVPAMSACVIAREVECHPELLELKLLEAREAK